MRYRGLHPRSPVSPFRHHMLVHSTTPLGSDMADIFRDQYAAEKNDPGWIPIAD